jgi:nickel-dependent lactate racemase
MTPVLKYGAQESVRLDSPGTELLGHCGVPNIEPLEDPAAAIVRALAQPLDYPPLGQSAVPGDRVVLAVGESVPHAAEIVAGVVRSLTDGPVDPDGIGVLHTRAGPPGGPDDPCRLLPEEVRSRVASIAHDPSDRGNLAYLATTEEGHQIELNRALIDADLVLPIGCVRDGSVAGYHGIHSPVYPTFSDARTLARFHSPKMLDSRGRRQKRLVKEADEVGWLLGVTFTIQVIPGPGEGVLDVLAGEVSALRHYALRRYWAAWHRTVPRRAELVLASLEGGQGQQTWENLGRALAAGAALVEEGGALAVCCELAADRGPAVQCLTTSRTREEAVARIRDERPEDAVPAIQLAQALDHCSVYLLSRLEPSVVEDLDITPMADADEVSRLFSRHGSCILLANAPYASVTVESNHD